MSTRKRNLLLAGVLVVNTAVAQGQEDQFRERRETMVARYVAGAGVQDDRVLAVLREVPRHEFVPPQQVSKAYRDRALPIGYDQTISSPYIVARMTEQLAVMPSDRILEIGTGSGYQAAVLGKLAKDVFTVEIVPELARRAEQTLQRLGYANVHVRAGDGYQGWAEQAPFDKIIVTCSPEKIPQPLVDQLADGGMLVVPLGHRFQQVLYRFRKQAGKLTQERIESTFFVPMTGQADRERPIQAGTSSPASLVNGGFEAVVEGTDEPSNWYYIRGGSSETDPSSPEGKRVLRFHDPKAAAWHALQPVGIDGATSRALRIEFWARRKGIHAGLVLLQASQVIVEFYDETRALVGEGDVPVALGSADWQHHQAVIDVPKTARFAIVGLGLFGVAGEISFDDVCVTALP